MRVTTARVCPEATSQPGAHSQGHGCGTRGSRAPRGTPRGLRPGASRCGRRCSSLGRQPGCAPGSPRRGGARGSLRSTAPPSPRIPDTLPVPGLGPGEYLPRAKEFLRIPSPLSLHAHTPKPPFLQPSCLRLPRPALSGAPKSPGGPESAARLPAPRADAPFLPRGATHARGWRGEAEPRTSGRPGRCRRRCSRGRGGARRLHEATWRWR